MAAQQGRPVGAPAHTCEASQVRSARGTTVACCRPQWQMRWAGVMGVRAVGALSVRRHEGEERGRVRVCAPFVVGRRHRARSPTSAASPFCSLLSEGSGSSVLAWLARLAWRDRRILLEDAPHPRASRACGHSSGGGRRPLLLRWQCSVAQKERCFSAPLLDLEVALRHGSRALRAPARRTPSFSSPLSSSFPYFFQAFPSY